jgi:hypothetical protein
MHMVKESAKQATRGDLLELKDELVKAIRISQSDSLRGFYSFSQTIQDRFQEWDQTEANVKRRLTNLESRTFEIEKQLNITHNATDSDKRRRRIEKAKKAARARWDKTKAKIDEN